MSRQYIAVSGAIFGIVALLQAVRALIHLPLHLGTFEVPVWASWIAALVAGSLCVWALRS